MLRGRLNSVVLPLLVSMLARITVSVRVPIRLGPASPPSSRTLSRGLLAHGSRLWLSRLARSGVRRVGRVALFVFFSL